MALPVSTLAKAKSISMAQIQELSNRYFDLTFKDVDDSKKPVPLVRGEDAKCCWFSMDEIDQLLTSNNCPPPGDATRSKYGIRIYYGMHHPSNSFQPTDPTYAERRQETVVLVVTENTGDGIHTDLLTDEQNFVSLGGGDKNTSGEGMDNGALCPPTCDGGEKIHQP